MQTTVLVIGYPTQTQTKHQVKQLQQAGAQVIVIDPYGNEGAYASLAWEQERIIWAGQALPLSTLKSVLFCANAPEYPIEAAFQTQQPPHLSWEDWFQHYGTQRDRSDSLLSLVLTLEQLGIPCFNPPSKSQLSRRKPYQLHLMRSVGCQLPQTLITNDTTAAANFIKQQGACIVKPAAGGSLTLSANALLEQDELKYLAAPAIFQQRIRGRDIRVVVIEGEVVSSAIIDIAEDTLDFRGDSIYQQGKAHYIEVTLPQEVIAQCQRAAQVLGLRLAGIDIRVTPNHEYFLLECNSSPIYLDVEYKLGHPITKSLVNALTAK